jgi:hypothetical protein
VGRVTDEEGDGPIAALTRMQKLQKPERSRVADQRKLVKKSRIAGGAACATKV